MIQDFIFISVMFGDNLIDCAKGFKDNINNIDEIGSPCRLLLLNLKGGECILLVTTLAEGFA